MQRLLLHLAVFFIAAPCFAIEIDWRVEHPYRYYRYHSDLTLHEWAYHQLRAEAPMAAIHAPISHMERKLNNPSWWDDDRLSAVAALRATEGRQPERPTPTMIRHGWASLLRSAPAGFVDGTCWHARRQNHSRCDGAERLGTTGNDGRYLKPAFHRVVLSLTNADPATLDGPCQWEAESEVLLRPGSDAEWRTVRTERCADPVVARIPYIGNDAAPVALSVTTPDGAWAQDDVHVKDYLVFGLGDSFSSGEGNPEIPARLHPTRAIGPMEPRLADLGEVDGRTTFFGVPRRAPADGSSAAKWTDRRCHRSVYSYQNRVALQLAIAPDADGNHHHAVTFFHFACSGAEVTEDIFYAWEGRECIGAAQRLHRSSPTAGKGPRHRYYMAQISKASVALCGETTTGPLFWLTDITGTIDGRRGFGRLDHYRRQRRQFRRRPDNHCDFHRDRLDTNPRLLYCRPGDRLRKVDLLLSSAGGNDAGFSGIIANTIVTVPGAGLISLFYPDMMIDEESARRRLRHLPHRLTLYDRALREFLGPGADGADGPPVITLLYPNLIYRSGAGDAGRFCPSNNAGMDVSPYLGIRSRAQLQAVERLVEGRRGAGQSYDGMIEIIRARAAAFGWTVVDGHRRAFMDRGICASDPAASPDESGRSTAEILAIPHKRVDFTRVGTPAQYAGPWRRYDPVSDLYPYETRKSWFRTPNLDFMTTHYLKGSMPDDWTLDRQRVSALFLANRILGGSFHPTAEGHAHIADHVYCKAREKLFGEACHPAVVNAYAYKW